MSDHLPECPGPAPCDRWDICDRLRACEQRVLLSKPNIELSAVYGYEAGRSDGLNAAREAVAATPERAINAKTGDPLVGWTAMRNEALAAIDALRGDA